VIESPLHRAGKTPPAAHVDGKFTFRSVEPLLKCQHLGVATAAFHEDGYSGVNGAAGGMKEHRKASWTAFVGWKSRGLDGVKLDCCNGI